RRRKPISNCDRFPIIRGDAVGSTASSSGLPRSTRARSGMAPAGWRVFLSGRFARQAVAVIPEVNRWVTSRTDVVQRGLKAPLSADYRKELCKMQQLGRTLTTQSVHKRNHCIAPAPGTSPVVEQTE